MYSKRYDDHDGLTTFRRKGENIIRQLVCTGRGTGFVVYHIAPQNGRFSEALMPWAINATYMT